MVRGRLANGSTTMFGRRGICIRWLKMIRSLKRLAFRRCRRFAFGIGPWTKAMSVKIARGGCGAGGEEREILDWDDRVEGQDVVSDQSGEFSDAGGAYGAVAGVVEDGVPRGGPGLKAHSLGDSVFSGLKAAAPSDVHEIETRHPIRDRKANSRFDSPSLCSGSLRMTLQFG